MQNSFFPHKNKTKCIFSKGNFQSGIFADQVSGVCVGEVAAHFSHETNRLFCDVWSEAHTWSPGFKKSDTVR